MFMSDSALSLSSLDVVSWAFDNDEVLDEYPVRSPDFIAYKFELTKSGVGGSTHRYLHYQGTSSDVDREVHRSVEVSRSTPWADHLYTCF
jgi:hypothetical protein